jgi:hypothetical protein
VVVGHREGGKVVKARRSLGTASLREAQRLRWAVVAELKASPSSTHPIDDPESWKAALKDNAGGWGDPEAALSDHLDRLEAKHGTAAAVEFADRAYGRATPLDAYLDPFLASRGKLREDTERRHRWAVKALADWLKANHLPQTIEAVDGRMATRYVDALPRDAATLSGWACTGSGSFAGSTPPATLGVTSRLPPEPV